jgi:pimeloyl-ACP methyl ester carboxylesterase
VRCVVTWSTPSRLDRYTGRRKAEWKRTGALEFTDPRAGAPLRLDYSYYEDIDANRERFDLRRAAASLGAPHLVVHGERDAAVSISEADVFFEDPPAAEKRFERIPGCGHTFGVTHPMERPTAALDRAVSVTVEWFAGKLGGISEE